MSGNVHHTMGIDARKELSTDVFQEIVVVYVCILQPLI